jgi:AcrR family transcriptional regulator
MPKTSRSREATARLNEETVVDAALALIAQRGLDGLSMRALGEQLGVEAMSLYHWFSSKDRLLDAVADQRLTRSIGAYINGIVLAEVAPSPAQQSSLPSETAAALKLPALDGAFEYGLACILDGAQKRLPNKHRGRS